MGVAPPAAVLDEVEGQSDAELVALVIGRASGDVLARAGGVEALSRAGMFEIVAHLEGRELDALDDGAALGAIRGEVRGARRRRGGPKPATLRAARALAAAFELGRRAEIGRAAMPERVGCAADVARWAEPRLTRLTHEELWMIALDGRGHVRAARCVARGGLHGAAVRAADPLRAALRADASAFVLVHNHPSGDPTPSKEDVALTASVAKAAAVVGLVLLDHVVVARAGFACVPMPGEARSPLPAEHEASPRRGASA